MNITVNSNSFEKSKGKNYKITVKHNLINNNTLDFTKLPDRKLHKLNDTVCSSSKHTSEWF